MNPSALVSLESFYLLILAILEPVLVRMRLASCWKFVMGSSTHDALRTMISFLVSITAECMVPEMDGPDLAAAVDPLVACGLPQCDSRDLMAESVRSDPSQENHKVVK